MTPSPEGLLLSDTLMKAKTVLKDKDHEYGLDQGEPLNEPLDQLPKRLLPPVVDRWDCVADHDVAEDNDSDGDEAVEAEEKGDEETSRPTEGSSNDMAAIDWVGGAIDEEYEAEAEDLGNAVADDHLVHPVLLLLQDDHHRPGVE